VDGLGRLDAGALEVLTVEHDVLTLLVGVTLDDVAPVDRLAGLAVDPLITNRRHVAAVEQVKVEVVSGLGGVEPDGDLHEAEADGTLPDRAGGHGRLIARARRLSRRAARALRLTRSGARSAAGIFHRAEPDG